jgi:hypothetical protein
LRAIGVVFGGAEPGAAHTVPQSETSSQPTDSERRHLAIRGELEKLRLGSGIDEEKVAACDTILALPVVASEMLRNAAHTRTTAAYSVIKCCVHYEISNPTYRRVLGGTLNFYGWSGTLTARRKTLQRHLGVDGDNNYARRERSAYIELAGLLLVGDRSPCWDRRIPTLKDHLNKSLSDIASDQLTAISLVTQLLQLMTSTQDEEEQESIAESLLALLPRLQTVLAGDDFSIPHDPQYPVLTLYSLLRWVLYQVFMVHRKELARSQIDEDIEALIVFFRRETHIEFYMKLFAERELRHKAHERNPRLIGSPGPPATPESIEAAYARWRRSCQTLAERIVEIESADRWGDYIGRPGSSSDLVNV